LVIRINNCLTSLPPPHKYSLPHFLLGKKWGRKKLNGVRYHTKYAAYEVKLGIEFIHGNGKMFNIEGKGREDETFTTVIIDSDIIVLFLQ
jgi:hypothetical protein